MRPEYDIGKVEDVLEDFRRATGVTITLFSAELRPVTAKGTNSSRYCRLVSTTAQGAQACHASNMALLQRCCQTRQMQRHICAAGLVDMAVPLLEKNEVLGYLMLGQLRIDDALPVAAQSLPVDLRQLREHYLSLPLFNEDAVTSVLHLAAMLTRYILLERMVRPRLSRGAERVATFIDAHLTEKLTTEEIAKAALLSPSGLYKCVRQSFGCTVNELVTTRRIERALPLLENTALSVEQIAERVGFADASGFSRRFKKEMGLPPLQYRKRTAPGGETSSAADQRLTKTEQRSLMQRKPQMP